jgi:hypothetical protein
MTAVQNLGLAVGALAIGFLLTATDRNYALMSLAFAGSAAVSCLCSVLLFYVDAANGSILNASSARLKVRQLLTVVVYLLCIARLHFVCSLTHTLYATHVCQSTQEIALAKARADDDRIAARAASLNNADGGAEKQPLLAPV